MRGVCNSALQDFVSGYRGQEGVNLVKESGYGITSQWLFRDKCIIMEMYVELSGAMGNRGIEAEKLY